jgi:hypothetical protein
MNISPGTSNSAVPVRRAYRGDLEVVGDGVAILLYEPAARAEK